MTLDEDLQAIRRKLAAMKDNGDTTFDERERELLADMLGNAEQRHEAGAGLAGNGRQRSGMQREIDFFLVCLGWSLAVFAILATLNWSGDHAMDGAGVFGVAFVAGLSAAALRAFYIGAWQPAGLAAWQIVAGLVLLISLITLAMAGAIGAALGMVVGAVVFHALVRNRHARRVSVSEQG
ncbi:hypothetical protein [Salinisphaera sp. T31B1]|uniref:hypothetical protein n=1 Tax=Salinisphaera sp. T31B1 TaxID=727963 RepID=UPI0033402F38